MYSLWWPNHIVHAHVSKVAKNLHVVCENITSVHKFLILWQFEIWEDQISLTHIHNYLMGTITFEVHPITPTSPGNTLATIFKNMLILLAFDFLCIFLFEHIMHGHIRERKEIPSYVKPKNQNFTVPKHTNVIHDCQTLVVRWLFMPFS